MSAKYELENLETAIRDAAKGVLEFETDNPYIILQLLRMKALAATHSVEIGERVPAMTENPCGICGQSIRDHAGDPNTPGGLLRCPDDWEKGPRHG